MRQENNMTMMEVESSVTTANNTIVTPEGDSAHTGSSINHPHDRHTFTHLTYSRHHLVDVAMETINIAENGSYINIKGETVKLKEELDYAVEHCVHYDHEFDFHEALKKYDDFVKEEKEAQRQAEGGGGGIAASFKSPRRLLGHNSQHPNQRFLRTSFLVVSASWIESASQLLHANNCKSNGYYRVGVLNSGSGTTPGGRFLKGTVSQEDCLCRASLLYSCISQPKFMSEGRFYGKNRSLRYGTSNCVIFSPDVPVIREDTVEGKLLDAYEKVSFVTIPAPNAFTTSSNTGKEYNDVDNEHRPKGIGRNISICSFTSMEETTDEKLEQKRKTLLASLSDRIHRALSAFVLGNCTDLVLPAFGCGVHGNDPTMVASVFRELLSDPKQFGGRFRTVVFAVPPCRKQNYQAFQAFFQKKEEVKKMHLVRGVTWD